MSQPLSLTGQARGFAIPETDRDRDRKKCRKKKKTETMKKKKEKKTKTSCSEAVMWLTCSACTRLQTLAGPIKTHTCSILWVVPLFTHMWSLLEQTLTIFLWFSLLRNGQIILFHFLWHSNAGPGCQRPKWVRNMDKRWVRYIFSFYFGSCHISFNTYAFLAK